MFSNTIDACPICGTRVSQITDAPQPPSKPSGGISKGLLAVILGAVGVLIILMGVIIFLLLRKPSSGADPAPQAVENTALASPSSASAYEPAQPRYDVYACAYDGFVWICSEPTTKSTWLAKFRNGSKGARKLDTSNGWTLIDYDGTVGWVVSQYITDVPTRDVSVDLSDGWQVGWWTDGSLNVLVFDNGTWECSGEIFIFSRGTYIEEGNALNFKTVQYFYDHGGERIEPGKLTIDKASGRLGPYHKATFCAPGDYGAGTFTKDQFRSLSKSVYKEVKRAQGGKLRF